MQSYIVDYIRTPFAHYNCVLQATELGAHAINTLMARNPPLSYEDIDDVILGCRNMMRGNIARETALLSGLSVIIPGITVNRSCASGIDAVAVASRQITANEADMIIAGGIECMMTGEDASLSPTFANPELLKKYGALSSPELAECVADEYAISRVDQDKFTLCSLQRAALAQKSGRLAKEMTPIEMSQKGGEALKIDQDARLRKITLRELAQLPTPFRKNGTVTAGNSAAPCNGAAVLLLVSETALKKYDLIPMARVVGAAAAAVPPRIMGIGTVPASLKLMARLGMTISDFDIIEINEDYAAHALASIRCLQLRDDAQHVNPNGGSLAYGYASSATGVRLAGEAAAELQHQGAKRALVTMCAEGGQGIALALEHA